MNNATATAKVEVPDFLPSDIDIAKLQNELDAVHTEVAKQAKEKEISQNLDKLEAKSQTNALEKGYEDRQEKRDEGFWEKCKNVFEKVGNTLKTVVEYAVVKPAEFVWDFVKKHPYWTLAIVLSAVGAYYYFGVVGVGLEQIPKEAVEFYQNMGEAGAPTGGYDNLYKIAQEKAAEVGPDVLWGN